MNRLWWVVPFALFASFGPTRARAGDSCTIAYRLAGEFQVTDTYRGKGDVTIKNLPGSLVLELSQDRDGRVSEGKVKVLHFAMYEKIVVDALVDVTSVTHHFTPSCNGVTEPTWRRPSDPGFPKACEYRGGDKVVAVGAWVRDEGRIEWARCNAAATYWAKDREAYKPSDKSRGRGCLSDLHAVGNVHCDGRLGCRFGGLSPGDNPQYDVWNQPLIHGPEGSANYVTMTPDLKTIRTPTGRSKEGFQSYNVPNAAPSRTWFSWVATRDDKSRYTTCP